MGDPIVVERHIAAPAEVVYDHLTDSESWSRWQGVGAQIDARPGGIFGVTMGNGMMARGQFVELVPNRRVVFTWGWIDHPGLPPGSSTVEVVLVPEGDGTRVTLTHRELPDEEIAPHTAGWERYVPRLAMASEGTDPGPDDD